MASRNLALAVALGLAAALATSVASAGDAEQQQQQPSVAAAAPLYKLPKVGKPTGRVGGGRRGAGSDLPALYALVPDHVGYTTQRQPTLYWFLPEGAKGDLRFELTLIDEASVEPLIDRPLASPPSPGLNRIQLAGSGVKLEPGQEYQWSVALVPDKNDRSKDVVSSGWIEVVAPPDDLAARVEAAGPDGAAAVYGANGLWYDTLAAAIADVERNPSATAPRQRLAGLLAEAGLPADAAR